jgi:hypothetical protein
MNINTTCQTNRFNFSSSNFSLFPKNTQCLENTALVFTPDASATELNDEGKWLFGDINYSVSGGPSSKTFLRRYVRRQCPETFKIVVIPKWVLPKNPIYRDNSMGLKRGQLFTNTAYKLTKSQKVNMLSNKRFNR